MSGFLDRVASLPTLGLGVYALEGTLLAGKSFYPVPLYTSGQFGFRYRGAASPPLDGVYLYGDFCRGTIWGATPDGDGTWSATELLETDLPLSAFGEDEAGELYVAAYAPAPSGAIHRIVGPAGDPDDPDDPGEPGDPDDPDDPDDTWLTTPEIPGYRFRVRITADGVERPVRREADCIPETLCVSGAVSGRSELFVRIVGPKPNGRLWPTLVRFTTSSVEVWIEQLATGDTRHYVLEGAVPGSSDLDGLFDRDGFEP